MASIHAYGGKAEAGSVSLRSQVVCLCTHANITAHEECTLFRMAKLAVYRVISATEVQHHVFGLRLNGFYKPINK